MNSFRIDLSLPVFVSEYKRARKKHPTVKNDVTAALGDVETNPRLGDHMPRVGENLFKIRVGVKGQFGKSGGYRMIYHVDFGRKVIAPIAFYFKPEKANLSDSEVAERFEQVTKLVEQQQLLTAPLPPGSKSN